MVMQIHTGEFYYIGDAGAVLNTADSHWVGWYNSFFRTCVPLFVMISGYFLFPVNDEKLFFKKRLARVAVPFVIWCSLYAFYQYFRGQADLQTALINILKIPVNFGTEVGHLWFVYMLIGIYLFAPVISPWVQSAGKKSMQLYLVLWAISLLVPYIHLVFPEVLGEAFWNHTPLLYYFSGFLGYVILAAYIRRFMLDPKAWHYTIGIILITAGYAVTAYGFLHRLNTEPYIMTLELTWGFETLNVAMMACGLFMIFKNLHSFGGSPALNSLLSDIAAKSYGMYLAHIMVLNAVYAFLNDKFSTAAIKIPLIAVTTFAATYLFMKLLSLLPKSKWIVG